MSLLRIMMPMSHSCTLKDQLPSIVGQVYDVCWVSAENVIRPWLCICEVNLPEAR